MPNLPETIICIIVLTTEISSSVPVSSFYSYGPRAGDIQLGPADDDSTEAIQLPTTFVYYNSFYNAIYVSSAVQIKSGSDTSFFFSSTLSDLA